MTEVKFENTINRITSLPTRQIERVVRGAQFGIMMVYDIVNEKEIEDFESSQSTKIYPWII